MNKKEFIDKIAVVLNRDGNKMYEFLIKNVKKVGDKVFISDSKGDKVWFELHKSFVKII